MADDKGWQASGFDETSLGWNYVKLSLTLLEVSAKMSADLAIEAGTKFSVALAGSYSLKLPSISGTVWMGTLGTVDYSGSGSESVTIDGNPITLQTALVKHENVASTISAAGAKLYATGAKKLRSASKTNAKATRAVTSGNRNRLGGRVSTGGSS
ncbi:MAG: hypothetical protein RIB84_07935 [Sneathiellaceae bacterium]